MKRGTTDYEARKRRRAIREIARMKPYDLSAPSLELIERVKSFKWFIAIGQPLHDDSLKRATSIADAKRRALSDAYINVLIDECNQMTLFLDKHDRKRFNTTYNEIIHTALGLLRPTFDLALITASQSLGALNEDQRQDLQAIIQNPPLMAIHEIEYADIFKANLGHRLLKWYECGHWPCGFNGRWPDVEIIVY